MYIVQAYHCITSLQSQAFVMHHVDVLDSLRLWAPATHGALLVHLLY